MRAIQLTITGYDATDIGSIDDKSSREVRSDDGRYDGESTGSLKTVTFKWDPSCTQGNRMDSMIN
jgi:hypothetical protein